LTVGGRIDALLIAPDPDPSAVRGRQPVPASDAFRTHSAKMHRGNRLSDCADGVMQE